MQLEGAAGDLFLGGDGQEGGVILRSGSFAETIHLEGNTATASNALSVNGFIKGWARIGSNDVAIRSYNCDPNVMKTQRTALGIFR